MNPPPSPQLVEGLVPDHLQVTGQDGQCALLAVVEAHRREGGVMAKSRCKGAILILALVQVKWLNN